MMNKEAGITLIELVIVVVIIAVLAAVTFPAYQQHVIKANRSDGHTTLTNLMQQQERYFANNLSYTTDLKDLGYAVSNALTSEGKHYQITATTCGTPYSNQIKKCVKLQAVAVGSQTSDGDLTFNSAGIKTPSSKW